MTDTITIGVAEHQKMQRDLAKLYALEAGGVDGWEWYDESLKEWRRENAYQEMIDELCDGFVEIVDQMAIESEVDFPGGYECAPNVNVPRNDDEAKKFIEKVIGKYKDLAP